MGRKNQKFVVTLQKCNGGTPKVSFEVPRHKAERMMDIAQSDIEKKTKKAKCSSVTLEQFYKDD